MAMGTMILKLGLMDLTRSGKSPEMRRGENRQAKEKRGIQK
jgi:hypothetical protein